jgi:hypothetical protein
MTVDEFLSQQDSLRCIDCGHVGLIEEYRQQNNGRQVLCPACPSRKPLGSVVFLKQKGPRVRQPLSRSGESVEEVWAAWDNRCVGCGRTKEEIEFLGLACERDHAPPLAEVGAEDKTRLIPLCTRCHQSLTSNQALNKRQLEALRRRSLQNTIADLAVRRKLPPSVERAVEVREAAEQSIEAHNTRRRDLSVAPSNSADLFPEGLEESP